MIRIRCRTTIRDAGRLPARVRPIGIARNGRNSTCQGADDAIIELRHDIVFPQAGPSSTCARTQLHSGQFRFFPSVRNGSGATTRAGSFDSPNLDACGGCRPAWNRRGRHRAGSASGKKSPGSFVNSPVWAESGDVLPFSSVSWMKTRFSVRPPWRCRRSGWSSTNPLKNAPRSIAEFPRRLRHQIDQGAIGVAGIAAGSRECGRGDGQHDAITNIGRRDGAMTGRWRA